MLTKWGASHFLFFNEKITVIARRNDAAIAKFITKNESIGLLCPSGHVPLVMTFKKVGCSPLNGATSPI